MENHWDSGTETALRVQAVKQMQSVTLQCPCAAPCSVLRLIRQPQVYVCIAGSG